MLVSILKKSLASMLAVLLLAGLLLGFQGVVNWSQINPLTRHGTQAYGQASDGTGTSGNLAKFNGDGSLTDGPSLSANLIRPCEMAIGDPGAASNALADDNDALWECGNKFGATLTITAVECSADAGSPTVTPIITGGSGTSILTGALTCGTAGSFNSGTLNGTPTQTSGQTIDGDITTAGGTAKYIVIRITRTL